MARRFSSDPQRHERPARRSHAPRKGGAGKAFLLLGLVVMVLSVLLVLLMMSPSGDDDRSSGPQVAGSFAEPSGLRFVQWNIANMGRSKDATEIGVMADVLAPAADIVAIQEVSTSDAGSDAIVRLVAALEQRGGDWDWTVSNPTTGEGGSERYAYVWRSDRVRTEGVCTLEVSLAGSIDREPFLCTFVRTGSTRTEPILVASFHAVPTSKNPAQENVQLVRLHERYPEADLVVAGDFNLPADRSAFDNLRASGFRAALADQRTTYKTVRTPAGEHLASEYDNVFYEPAELTVTRAGVLDFSGRFPTLRDARRVSDHLPVLVEFEWR
ncbi:MAG: endonuclease/exonuclease/phosphatase family protein [Rhodothermaceae bacterium]|nr:endonuclease/exonuclease/phosphatase family protein [Rhodothermaceae bacterium]